jgi:hypothetical protein
MSDPVSSSAGAVGFGAGAGFGAGVGSASTGIWCHLCSHWLHLSLRPLAVIALSGTSKPEAHSGQMIRMDQTVSIFGDGYDALNS